MYVLHCRPRTSAAQRSFDASSRDRSLCLAIAAPVVADAQAWAYPAFQPPRVLNREFNFGVADAGHAGTTLIFQWREGLTPRTQLSFDARLRRS